MVPIGPRKKQGGERSRFRDKAYGTVATTIFPKDTKKQDTFIFYGDAGRGFGSRIKGSDKRSTQSLQHNLKHLCTLIGTNEYLSKWCCFCDSRLQHPQKANNKTNLGIVYCINKDCFSRQQDYSTRGRDNNAAINILKTGLYKEITLMDYPVFSNRPKTKTSAAAINTLAAMIHAPAISWIRESGASVP
ncbi:hypothetical protein BC941DRAFT_519206 [Chlamydoabsidia padenii]|nr:hypothetical protein BC941DRAFT_519206 [Chlamydoabsidia padenii]